jgi:hypothetical protein
MFLCLLGLPGLARVPLAVQLVIIHEPTPNQWIIISLVALSALAIFLRIKLG